MRRITSAATHGLLLLLVALLATGRVTYVQVPAATEYVVADASSQDRVGRTIEQPLPFLAGQGALETLLEINPRVNLRSSERVGDALGDDTAAARSATLSQLRLRVAAWQQSATARVFAFAQQGTLHGFSTPPPAPLS